MARRLVWRRCVAPFATAPRRALLDIGLVGWELDGVITGTGLPADSRTGARVISIRSDFDLEIGGDLLIPELRLEAHVPAVAVLGLPLGPGTIEGTVLGEDFQGAGTLDSGAASIQHGGSRSAGNGWRRQGDDPGG